MKDKKSRIKVLFSIYAYRIALDLCYFKVIVPNFYYNGYHDYRTLSTFLISWFVLILFSFPMEKIINEKKITFSNTILFALSLISIVPFSTLIYSGILNYRFIIMNVVYWTILFLLYFFVSKIPIKSKRLKIGLYAINDKFALIFGFFSLFTVLYIAYKYTHFRFNFNLFKVYELRSESKQYNFSIFLDYLFPCTRILNIIFLSYELKNRKYLIAFLFFIAQMLSFGVDGLKTTFFMPFVVLLIFIVYRIYKNDNFFQYKKLSLHGVTILSLFGLLENILLKSFNIANIIIRRVLLDPVYLNFCYVDFFSKNVPDYFKASFLRYFGFKTQYENLGNIIGNVYFGRITENCNNGLISDAVTNFGTIGIILMPILLICVLRFMDKCTNGLDEKVFFVVALYFAIILSNTFIFTALITHGILISAIILFMMSSSKSGGDG